MPITINDGWMFGSLPDDTGQEFPIIRFNRDDKPSPGSFLAKPHPCLHTTEGGSDLGERYKTWEFPPNFACGDSTIVQLYPLGRASHAVDTKDRFLMQIELAWRVGGKPVNLVYLPQESTLGPLVALAAWLHKTDVVSTFLKRPNLDWPVALDRGPQAVDTYYRRTDGTWPKPGVYGHVEVPDDEHWDPGSFDYPRFFARVQKAIEGGGDDVGMDDYIAGTNAAQEKALGNNLADIGVPPGSHTQHWNAGWNDVRFQVNRLKGRDGADGAIGSQGPVGPQGPAGTVAPHEHTVEGTAT